jgi:NAD dependent epimerase/dehydratase family enzyme
MTQRVVVVGATGQIGRPLCRELIRAGHAVVVFSRDPARAAHVVPGAAGYVAWHPDNLPEECTGHLGSADAVVYLAGGPLFDGRRRSREDIVAESKSRKDALGQLVTALGGLSRRPVNLTAPEPATAREFARALGRTLGRRAWLAVPAPLARMGLGVIVDILVRGKRVIPAGVSALGYRFMFPALDAALSDLLRQPDNAAAAAR